LKPLQIERIFCNSAIEHVWLL